MTIVTGKPASDSFFDDDGQAGALKAGFMGEGKTGKTYTGCLLAIAAREVLDLKGPIAMLDSESGSLYIKDVVFELTGQKMLVKRARDFATLIDFGKTCLQVGASAALVDSLTHFWREICESYLKQLNELAAKKGWRKYTKLEFQHWGPIKERWGAWTEFYLNSPLSIVVAGRAGYMYDNETNEETGRKELVKTGVKMKTEAEMGYEPSLLVLMEAEQNISDRRDGQPIIQRTATIMGDRFRDLDGKVLEFKGCGSIRKDYEAVKKAFLPHLEHLRGGPHATVDTKGRTHFDLNADGQTDGQAERKEREILTEQIQHALLAKWPSQSAVDKKGKLDALQDLFGKASWTYVESLDSSTLRSGLEKLQRMIDGKPQPAAGSGSSIRDDGASDEVPDFAPSAAAAVPAAATPAAAPTDPAAPAAPAHATAEQVVQICAVLMSADSAAKLTDMREELFARREAGTLVLTTDQSKLIRRTIEEKAQALAQPKADVAPEQERARVEENIAVAAHAVSAEILASPVDVDSQSGHVAPATAAAAAAAAATADPAPAAAAPPIQTGEAEVTQICKEIFALTSQEALIEYREGLAAQRESGGLKLTKDQGQRIRQTIEAKAKTLAAAAVS